jgi:thioester reductase-like protein
MSSRESIADLVARDPTSDLERMLADAVLPEDIVPMRDPWHRRVQAGGLRDARRVLLTGATGFLGRSLAKELLKESQTTLFCVVRPGPVDAPARLRAALADAGVASTELERLGESDGRVRVVEGDLSQPWLGIGQAGFEALAEEVDAVCHAGAAVNWARPYHGLKATNVDGTRHLLELACRRAVPFHFVSSLSVCYSTAVATPFARGPQALAPAIRPSIDDRYDALPDLSGLHLGYAQTKVVAEELVREVGRRGLPISIYRPSLIAGHSETGAFNPGDILARVVSGCVRMGTAPDLDWTLDCLPVDTAARRIIELSTRRGVSHLRHSRPRHWRECVLWMRLYGYDVRLVPYHTWLRQLALDTERGDRSHPLRPLRSFFFDRPAAARGRTQPELLLGSDRLFSADAHDAACDPPLDASLLQRYFTAFVDGGVLPPVKSARRTISLRVMDAAFFSSAMDTAVGAAQPLGRLSDHSIVSELTAWRSGCATGLFRYRLRGDHLDRDVVVKVKAPDHDVIAVGEALARLCDERIGNAYARWADRIGFVASDIRELGIYAQTDPRFARHAPAALGSIVDPVSGICTLILEHIANARLQDSANQPELWTVPDIDCAIRGLASLQAIWFGRERALLEQPWIGHVASTAATAEMADLWEAIAAHATPRFSAWADPAIGAIQRRLVDSIERWWRPLEALPRTLIHNDFNPRNICLRETVDGPVLTAYDWELATLGAPQHDLAELLCFVLDAGATDRDIDFWIERHRGHLQRETGVALDSAAWRHGFRAALYDLMLNRIPMYALIHRVRRQSFLPRIVRTWYRLYQRFPLAPQP